MQLTCDVKPGAGRPEGAGRAGAGPPGRRAPRAAAPGLYRAAAAQRGSPGAAVAGLLGLLVSGGSPLSRGA